MLTLFIRRTAASAMNVAVIRPVSLDCLHSVQAVQDPRSDDSYSHQLRPTFLPVSKMN